MTQLDRRSFLASSAGAAAGVAAGAGLGLSPAAAQAGGVLRIAMTASDIPLTTGQTDQGGEGQRFMGYTVYDSLINWDLSRSDRSSSLTPGLATKWEVDPANTNRWIFTIREGVQFHDGSTFTAEAAVWNFDKLLKEDSPQFDRRQSAQGRSRIPSIAGYRALSPGVLEITTRAPDATLPYQVAWIMFSSPAQWEAMGRNWDAVAQRPSGTGPWRLDRFVPRERAELVPFPGYWDKARVPKTSRMVLLPIPEANARVAALRGGQVDWIEAPASDAIASLRQAGFQITANAYPHNWTWHFARNPGSPWNDVRVRRAANLAVDRQGMKQLLADMMIPAEGFLTPGHAWFGNPTFKLRTDVDAAKRLMAEAGFSPQRPLRTKVLIAPSGSGQMQPLPMNELIQQNLADVGFAIEFEVVEWNTLINIWRAGAAHPSSRGASAMNYSYFIQDPFTAFIRHLATELQPPAGTNWGLYSDPDMDRLFQDLRTAFDPAALDRAMQRIHEKYVDEALFLMVTHDVGARAMHRRVQGFVQAQNWFQDFSPITIAG
ncbi:MAG: ABC transporter substrate-binding protein [Alphaproteobacteria bacterium]|nr:ABC transporter substrate-binding protein [Alphaproteobacteria bacterium]